MSLDNDLDNIAGGNSRQRHAVYRRRDLRNGLADRLGISERDRDPSHQSNRRNGPRSKRAVHDRKKRLSLLRVKNIPLETSDYEIEDWVKEIGEVASVRINDRKESRVASVEFKDSQLLQTALEQLNQREVHGVKIEAEIFEVGGKRNDRNSSFESTTAAPTHTKPGRPKPETKTKEELDQEMEDYMTQP